MKTKLVMAGVLTLSTATLFAQKNELTNAQSEYSKYEVFKQNKATLAQGQTSINTAKTSIDKAAANEKTATLPQTYALKAAIYSALAYQDTVASSSQPLFAAGDEAYKKAVETDAKGENKQLIASAKQYLGYYQLNAGVRQYQTKNYNDAYKAFDYYRASSPEDTTAIYYTALAANLAKNYDAAVTNYKKLATTNSSKKGEAYNDIVNIYLAKHDTTAALAAAHEGIEKFPNNNDLRSTEIQIGLNQGKQTEIIGQIQEAINKDPQNKNLYYYSGLAYSKVAENAEKSAKATKEPAKKATFVKTKDENFTQAAEMYKKALQIDPNFADASLNLGYVLMSPAIYKLQDANNSRTIKQTEYDALKNKVYAQLDQAKPYLDKAVELNPKSDIALTNLRNYYIIKNDNAHAAEIKKRIDAL
ncbi:tetratricopeptide repeat protein [Mucilaginibacter robiniae]|uniref:Tetratricopeptide repeat protein n=1 Tax=Mucilaginibacter robiniae TaxID=2728022 RepID=A0A7L5E710_9SPHI|nr:tetratricopeptide repeat protein [Mucilaginibacter robiniae]QJD98099.1 tetratricopeptide repeat protein [Mucilaginibacter robiniae]